MVILGPTLSVPIGTRMIIPPVGRRLVAPEIQDRIRARKPMLFRRMRLAPAGVPRLEDTLIMRGKEQNGEGDPAYRLLGGLASPASLKNRSM